MFRPKQKIFLFFTVFLFAVFLTGFFSGVVSAQAENLSFDVDSSYDLYGRKEIEATLVRTTENLYFYFEKSWWEKLSSQEQNDIRINLFNLGEEFKNRIYPTLTLTFGSEPKPGIDNDERITILFHQMRSEAAGYFNSADQYSIYQYSKSNEKDMLYLNTKFIGDSLIKANLAHEFVHLITFNQKEKLRRVTEETWLNESRAEYAITLLGYDDGYEGSNLEKRVKSFLKNPNDSLTEWTGKADDYGVIELFIQYLVDHYGKKILVDSLKSDRVGIESINYALKNNQFQEDFSQIFTNWTVAVLLNDCSLGNKYCYLNPYLKNLKIPPLITYLPYAESVLTANYSAKNWSGNWHKIIGGKGNLIFKFEGNQKVNFKVPYIICDYQNICSVKLLALDASQKGTINLDEFNAKYNSLSIIPSIQTKLAGFNGAEEESFFTLTLSISSSEEGKEEEALKQQLLARIAELNEEILRLKSLLSSMGKNGGESEIYSCQMIKNDLYFGMTNSDEVRCLQEFLKKEGSIIYPEGLITGNFLSLTQSAVIRFQEKYSAEILVPLGLEKGTGFFGSLSRNVANKLLGS